MTELPASLITYLADRDTQRASAVDDFLNHLTPRERALVREAAVMGYIQGLMRDRSEGAPKDSATVRLVVDACFAFPDLYPAVSAIAGTAPPKPVWQIETHRRDTWSHWTPERHDGGEARAEYDQCVASNGHRWSFRLVRSDATRIIEAAHNAEEQPS